MGLMQTCATGRYQPCARPATWKITCCLDSLGDTRPRLGPAPTSGGFAIPVVRWGLSGRAIIMEGKTDGEVGVMSSPGLSIFYPLPSCAAGPFNRAFFLRTVQPICRTFLISGFTMPVMTPPSGVGMPLKSLKHKDI